MVIAATINKYCYLTCRYLPPFFEHRIRVVYSKIEDCVTVDQIAHPSVRETLRYLKFHRGVEIHHDGDLPGRSGMGSSSAFTVGLLHALRALRGQMTGKRQLAEESIHIEQELLRETVGSQDQVCAAYGGLNVIQFLQNGDFTVRPVTASQEKVRELQSHLMLFYTGIKRTASTIASSYVTNMDAKAAAMKRFMGMIEESVAALNGDRSMHRIGELLAEAWEVKKGLGDKISNSTVDAHYEAARAAGALGGKLLGAGGGGFLLFFVPPERQAAVRRALDRLIQVPFEFESAGSQIVFFDPQEDYEAQDKERMAREINAFQELDAGGPP
jgi:D-glycero-alpha-D-manno-heptose-7-phosphate kinase